MKITLMQRRIIAVGIILLIFLVALFVPGRRYIRELFLSSAMYHAVENGNASQVTRLLKEGANPNRIGAGGLAGGTPLSWATRYSDIKIMKI